MHATCLAVSLATAGIAQDPQPSSAESTLSQLRDELAAARAELRTMHEALQPVAVAPAESSSRWQLLGDADSAWRVSGWLAQGGTWNPSAPKDHWNGPVSWMDRANEYELTELYVTIERRAGRPANGYEVGGRLDAMWGTNYRFVTSAGLESTWNPDDRYGVALPSAYLEFTTAHTSTIVGRFISPVGYFIVGTANNFFSTLPYTFAYGEPFTHTGVMTTVDVADDLQVRVGVTNGWDSTADWDSQRAGLVDEAWNRHVGALGMVTVTGLAEAGDSLAWFGSWSLEPDLSGLGRSSRYIQSLVYTLPVAPDWQWVVQSDFGFQHAAVPDPAGGREDAEWFGLNQYRVLRCRSRLAVGARRRVVPRRRRGSRGLSGAVVRDPERAGVRPWAVRGRLLPLHPRPALATAPERLGPPVAALRLLRRAPQWRLAAVRRRQRARAGAREPGAAAVLLKLRRPRPSRSASGGPGGAAGANCVGSARSGASSRPRVRRCRR